MCLIAPHLLPITARGNLLNYNLIDPSLILPLKTVVGIQVASLSARVSGSLDAYTCKGSKKPWFAEKNFKEIAPLTDCVTFITMDPSFNPTH